jgi:hypothetical protein
VVLDKPKRKHTFSITTARNSLYLFKANSDSDLKSWLDSIAEFTGPAKVQKDVSLALAQFLEKIPYLQFFFLAFFSDFFAHFFSILAFTGILGYW